LTNETKGDIIKTYEYDQNGNRTLFVLKQGTTEEIRNNYTYDNQNRTVKDWK